MSCSSSSSLLDLCLQPATTRETFFKEFFLKKPLHTKLPGRFDRHFRLSDLEFLWNTTMQLDPSSMLFFHQQTHPEGPITSLRSAFFAFAHQISVVVNKADRLSPSILKICKEFENHFPFVFCNVYSTPAGERTVPVHVDDRDVFILQVHGAKHWTIYDDPPIVLPYKSEELGKHQPFSPDDKFDPKTAKIAFEGTIEAGDVVYLPRGFPHVAKAVSHSASVHLTIAIQTSDWDVNALVKDGIEAILATAMRNGAVSGNSSSGKDKNKNDLPEAFGFRTVLPPSLLELSSSSRSTSSSSSKELLQSEDNKEFSSQLQSSLQLAFNQLSQNPHVCIDQFKNRLALKRSKRDEYFDENVASIRFFPLQLSSLILWCNTVQIVNVQPMSTTNPSQAGGGGKKIIGNISHIVILQKKLSSNQSTDPQVDTMQLTVSSTILEIMFLWQKHFTECPAPVSEMINPLRRGVTTSTMKDNKDKDNNHHQDCSLAALCTAGFLLRNGCLVRVS